MTLPPVFAAATLLSCSLLTGCALTSTAAPDSVRGSALSGVAFGGQQPLVSSNVYLLAANPGGYGSGSLSLLTTASTGNAVDTIGSYALTAASTGAFALAGDYDCTKGYGLGASTASGATTLPGSEQVYLYILGGSPGAGANSSAGLLAALGPCNAPYATSGLVVNELTTIAAAYAFAGYATDATHLASSGTALALTGLTNAGLNSANLVNIAGGAPVANSTGITRPVATLYTLADILAACINGTTANSHCTTLFQYTESAGATGTAATDTATAAINLAHNPWPTAAGMTALYGLVPGTGAPYTGGLSSQPNDFTLGLTYTGGGLNRPYSIAIDASGNAWTANSGNNSVSKLSSTGTAISGTGGYTGGSIAGPGDIAIDASGNAWITTGNTTLAELSSAGTAITNNAGYHGGGLSQPLGIAIDASGNAWTANSGNSTVSEFSSAGNAISTSAGYTGGGLSAPYGIAIDASGNAWTANSGNNSVSKLSSTGTAISTSAGYTGAGLSVPSSIAIDASGNAWTTNAGNNSVSKLSSTGAAISTTAGYTGGGINSPYFIAIDASGNAWTANYGNNSVSRFSSTGTAISPPSTGYKGGGFSAPNAIALDGSGDVWTSNYNGNSITELIGAATPVVTPLAANLITPYTTPASKP